MSSQGTLAQLAMDAELPFDASSEAYEFVPPETLKKTGTHLETEGIRGTRSHDSRRVVEGTIEVAGSITLHPTPAMLDRLLPRILGAAENDDVFDLAETLPEFQVMFDRVAKVYTYTGCKIDKATFKGSSGTLIELTLDIIGKAEIEGDAGTFPALTMPADAPYVFHQGALTLQSAARSFFDFELTIDNALAARFANSQTATDIAAQDRIVTFKCTTPFTAAEAGLYNQAVAGAAASMVFTNGSQSTTFDFAALQFPPQTPTVPGKSEIPLILEGTARRTAAAAELTVTNVSD